MLPEIVRVVLSQSERQRHLGIITPEEFENKLKRLRDEELTPRGLRLDIEADGEGHNRFNVTRRTTGELVGKIGRPGELAAAGSR
jgi:hypothetical protein